MGKRTTQIVSCLSSGCIHRMFAWNKHYYLSLLLLLFSFSTMAQTTVTGTVSDPAGEKLVGVTVKVKGSNQGVTTGSNGAFTLSTPADAVLVVSYIGFQTQEVPVSGQSKLNITLQTAASGLNEVLVIGFGKQSRDLVTSSISKLDKAVLENVPYSNVASALEGTIAGVRVQSTSGQPGAAPRVIVRGGTSINNPDGSAPLYIVDGVTRTDMNGLSGDDIESIQVLKDAASTAIYGARGSNGVVVVTTKSGKAGRTQVSYNYNLTFSNIAKKYDFVSARDFINYMRLGNAAEGKTIADQHIEGPANTANDLTNQTAFTPQYLTPENEYKLNEGWESMPDPLDPSKTIIFKNTDFQDVLFRTGVTHNHNIAVSGGTEKATFNLGVGYLTDKGIALTSKFNRLSLNFNGDLKVRDNLKFFARLMYTNTDSKDVFGSVNNMFGRSIATPPTTKYAFEDGSLAPGQNSSIGNPAYYSSTQDVKNIIDYFTIVVGGRWDLLPGLAFEPQVSLYKVSGYNRLFQQAYYNGVSSYVDSRAANAGYNDNLNKQVNAVFSYNKSLLNGHNIDATAGFSYLGTRVSNLAANGRGAATDLIPTLNASAEPVSVSGAETELVTEGYFARVNYNFQQRYLVSLSSRYDGASNLGDNQKWGLFPGISVGWNMHKENFWKTLPEDLFQLKLRASYGVNGNISGLGPYQAQGQYSVGSRYAGNAAVQNTVVSNSGLAWEQSKTFDAGFDLGVFNRRVNVMFDYYNRITENLLTNFSLPHSTGFASVLTNLGSLQNRGIEIEVTAQVLPAASALQWNASLNVAKVKTTILKLPENGTENNRIGGVYVWDPKIGDYAWKGGLQEGGAIGDLYAYKQMSIYATDKEAATAPWDVIMTRADKSKSGGDVNWLDGDRNDTIDTRDRFYMGNIYPTWTGGISNTFSYKNFSLSVRLDYASGHTIYNYTGATSVGQFQGSNNLSTEVLSSWKEQGDITDVPKFYWADQQWHNNLYRGNSRYYEKGDFLAVREVSLSYSFPQQMLRRMKLANLRCYVSGHNLHYFTNYTGLNPEEGGTDNGRYPLPRNIIFGLNVTL
ncbi:TonB-dependent receptor [Chitinophaga sp. MM2321]|uniref:SusC/RagA family TonB-linked outer membrane protein n=1 Tax=Chitinophaga sp. MM2321 TaxID=3137178 RepID=UPI0032D56773